MKFGETLWQRSVPQWRNFNIDYQTIKTYIKDATTPSRVNKSDSDKGKERAVSIPIPGSRIQTESPPSLEHRLLSVLQKEHDRVGLFVRSKCYEIASRLGSIERQLDQLQRRRPAGVSASKAAVRLRARFSKIESDILGVGNEIQNLSRFVAINRLAIIKLIKKHKKWTGSVTLGPSVQEQLLSQPESFTKTDLDQPLARYTSFLRAVREPFSDSPSGNAGNIGLVPPSSNVQDTPARAVTNLFQRSDVDFDAGMARLARRKREERAVYWVHQDNVVELRILLLQYMRHANFDGDSEGSHLPGKALTAPVRSDDQDSVAVPAGAIIMAKNSPNIASGGTDVTVSTHDNTPVPAAIARWTPAGYARVCLSPSATEVDASGTRGIVKLDKDRFVTLLPLDAATRRAEITRLADEELYPTSDDDKGNENILRGYIQQNEDLRAVARLTHKRSRFTGLENGSHKCFWASLDEDIKFSRMSGNERKACDVYTIPEDEGQQFPHAVLSLRSEGGKPSLIDALDETHLTERVEGFTLEAHALAMCSENQNIKSPAWLPKLTTDIRHIPSLTPTPTSQSSTCSRKSSTIDRLTNNSSSKQTPNLTSRSGTSNSLGPVTPDAETIVPSAVRGPNKKASKAFFGRDRGVQWSRRVGQRPSRPEMSVADSRQQRYWNEYDNPDSEMGGDEGFYVYVDPDAPWFPGQGTLVQWGQKVKQLFSGEADKKNTEPDVERQGPVDGSAIVRRQTLQLLSDSGITSSDDDDADDELSRHLLNPAQVHSLPSKPSIKPSVKSKNPAYGTFGRLRHSARKRHSMSRADMQPSFWPQTSGLCFAAAILIEIAMSLLLNTARRSLRREVDVAVMVGVVAALSFAAIGAGACTRRKHRGRGALIGAAEEPDTVANGAKTTLRVICFVVVCVWAGVLVALSVLG